MRRMARSLRVKAVVLLSLAMLPAGVLAALQALSNYRQLSALAQETMLQAAVLSTQEGEAVFTAARRVLDTLAVLPEITVPIPARCNETLKAVGATSSFYGALALADDRGNVLCSFPPAPVAENISDRLSFRSVMNRRAFTVTGGSNGHRKTDNGILTASLPIVDAAGSIAGVLFLAIQTNRLKDHLAETAAPEVAHLAIVDTNGNVIFSDSAPSSAPGWPPDRRFLRANMAGGIRAVESVRAGESGSLIALAPLMRDGLYVVLGGAPGSALGGSGWRLAGAIGFPLVMWLIALGVAWFGIERMVVRPILRLERTAAAFAAGKETVRVSDLSDMPDEIARLGKTMNFMADTLAARQTDLRRAVDEQKTLLKELHHRVKNNLQVITSLLNLQIHRSTEEGERRTLRAMQDRVYALSTVHDSLSRVSGDSLIRLDETLSRIADHMIRANWPTGERGNARFDMDPVRMHSKSAVPMALLLTEAISTALRVCRQDDCSPEFLVSLKQADDETVFLTIACDGSATDSSAYGGNDLSAKLVAGYVKQLGGQYTLTTEAGYRLRVSIPHPI